MEGFAAGALDAALYDDRRLWRLHAIRRTLFVAAAADAEVLASATRDIARAERQRLEKMLAVAHPELDAGAWIAAVEGRVLDILAAVEGASTQALAAELPELAVEVVAGSGKWTQTLPLSSRLLLVMAMEGRIVRGAPAGSWRSSQYAWSATSRWFAERPAELAPEEARAALVRRYLERYGPATLDDVTWWTGWGVRACRRALAKIGAAEVALGAGAGFVLPGDLEGEATIDGISVALLPSLDSTAMGWKRRDWYLCEGWESLYDRNGNVGPTIWADGRIVGGWATGGDGTVRTRLLVDVGSERERLVAEECERLTEWLGGTAVTPRFRTPLERELAGE